MSAGISSTRLLAGPAGLSGEVVVEPATRCGPLVIEFVGPPGSGKSTLLPVVVDACRLAGLQPYTQAESARQMARRTMLGRVAAAVLSGRTLSRALWLVFRWSGAVESLVFLLRNWRLGYQVLRSQTGRPPGAEAGTRRVLYWYWRLLGAYGLFLRHAAADEVLILDEGFVHRVVQLFSSTVEVPDAAGIRRYLGLVPAADLVVSVNTPLEACIERVTGRGVWERFTGRDRREVVDFLSHAHRAASHAVSYARKGGFPMIEVDNRSEDLDATKGVLVERVSAWFPGVRPERS